MTRNGATEMIDTNNAGEVVEAGPFRIRLLLIAVLTALAVTATALVITATPLHNTQQAGGVPGVRAGPGQQRQGRHRRRCCRWTFPRRESSPR